MKAITQLGMLRRKVQLSNKQRAKADALLDTFGDRATTTMQISDLRAYAVKLELMAHYLLSAAHAANEAADTRADMHYPAQFAMKKGA